MRRCEVCVERYPSHEVLGGKCPECRRLLDDELTENQVKTVWEEAEAFFSHPTEDFFDVT